MSRRVVFCLAVSALVSASAVASAQIGPPPPRVGPPRTCPTPTLTECQKEMRAGPANFCKRVNETTCRDIVANAFHDKWNLDQGCGPNQQGCTGLDQVILPGTMPRHAGILIDAAQEPFDDSSLWATGAVNTDLSYASVSQNALLPGRFAGLDIAGRHPDTTPRHPETTTIASCEQYVFDKYYDYARFEEAAASCKSDYLCLGELFAMVGDGSPGMDKPTLYSRDRARSPLSFQFRPQPGEILMAQTVKKNPFFASSVVQRLDERVARLRGTIEEGAMMAAFAAGYAADYSFVDGVGHDLEMRAKQAPLALTLAEYRKMELRQLAYTQALAQFQAELTKVGPNAEKYLHPSRYDSCGYLKLPGGGTNPSCPAGGTYRPPFTAETNEFFFYTDRIVNLLVREWEHTSPRDGSVDHGCLDPASIACDWSPKSLVQYLHLADVKREADFNHCMRDAADNFVSQFPPMDASATRADARTDWDALEVWFGYAEDQREKVVKDLPWVDSGMVGDKKVGSNGLGDPSWFSAEYSYQAHWGVHMDHAATEAKTVCNMQPELSGNVGVSVHVLGTKITLAEATVQASAGTAGNPDLTASGSLIVLDTPFVSTSPSADTFHLASPPIGGGPAYSQTVFIGFVPVTVGASAELTAGFEANVTARAPQSTDVCNLSTEVSIDATFAPYATASGRVWGAIGGEFAGLGAEAGIEGNLTLVDVRVPFHAGAHLKSEPFVTDDGLVSEQLALHLTNDAKLKLTLLKGDVKAYAEVCYLFGCKRIEHTIFSWDGLSYDHDLWKPLDKGYPIIALATAQPPVVVTP